MRRGLRNKRARINELGRRMGMMRINSVREKDE
jgi:hypothetical protein